MRIMAEQERAEVERLWQAARYMPQSVRLLGTRYRALFLAYAASASSSGEARAVADALAFIEFMFKQDRVGLLEPEQKALRSDARALRRRFRLKRADGGVTAVEKWKVLQWLHL